MFSFSLQESSATSLSDSSVFMQRRSRFQPWVRLETVHCSLRCGQSCANTFTHSVFTELRTGKWPFECSIFASSLGLYGSLRVHGTFASPTALCRWRIIISWILILQWTQLRQRCRTDVIRTTRFVQMCHSSIPAQRVSLLVSHHICKPFVNKTSHTRDWTADRKHLEHGFHSDCHTVHVHELKCHFQRTLRWNRRSCGSQKCPSSGRTSFCFARPRMACSSRIQQKLNVVRPVPEL